MFFGTTRLLNKNKIITFYNKKTYLKEITKGELKYFLLQLIK